jgi:hypothetical protein
MTKKLLIFTIFYLSTLSFLIAQPSVLDETIQWSDFQQFNMNIFCYRLWIIIRVVFEKFIA